MASSARTAARSRGARKGNAKRNALELTFLDLDSPDLLTDMEEPPKVLYHYTTASGFEGIVKDRCLRATHHRYLNDRGEISFGFEVALGVLNDLQPKLGQKLVTGTRAKIEELRRGDSFLACVSARRNTLSQWRAYASDGAGFCLGFQVKERTISAVAQEYALAQARRELSA